MNKTARTLRTLGLVPVLLLSATVAGCSESAPAADPATVTSSSSSSSSSPPPLPLTAHVLTELAGFETAGEVELLDVVGFAKAHEKSASELEAAGMVAAAAVQLEPSSGQGAGMSIAQQFAEVSQAQREADRLFAVNSEGDPGTTVTPLEVSGIPDARAVTMAATQGKQELAAVTIVFVTEAVVHEVFAFGAAEALDVPDVVAHATALYESVVDRPVA